MIILIEITRKSGLYPEIFYKISEQAVFPGRIKSRNHHPPPSKIRGRPGEAAPALFLSIKHFDI